jgi:hypothetical protein
MMPRCRVSLGPSTRFSRGVAPGYPISAPLGRKRRELDYSTVPEPPYFNLGRYANRWHEKGPRK